MVKRTKSSPQRVRAGRPTPEFSVQLNERVRHAALHTFLEKGFEGATMEAVARAAAITKRTLYARYADKPALFADVVTWALERYHWHEPEGEKLARSLEAGLMAIARSALARAKDPDIVRLSRMAIAEAARIPDFASRTYATTWSPRIGAVIALLSEHAKTGKISVDNVDIAAEHFLAMVGSLPAWLAAFGQSRPPEVEEQYLQHAVSLFLRGLQPQKSK